MCCFTVYFGTLLLHNHLTCNRLYKIKFVSMHGTYFDSEPFVQIFVCFVSFNNIVSDVIISNTLQISLICVSISMCWVNVLQEKNISSHIHLMNSFTYGCQEKLLTRAILTYVYSVVFTYICAAMLTKIYILKCTVDMKLHYTAKYVIVGNCGI